MAEKLLSWNVLAIISMLLPLCHSSTFPSPVLCGEPAMPNAVFSPCDDFYGGTCIASCADGYVGSPGAVCSALPGASTGFWKYTGSCDKVSCGPPSRPNTIFSPCDTHYGGTCTASCAVGYTGSVSAVCWVASGSLTGFWDYDGQCSPVSCGQPAVNGAHFEDCDTHYGGTCTASCAAGYTGSVSAICSAAAGASEGHWLYVGTCIPVLCGEPAMPNAVFSPCDDFYGGTCIASCADVYVGSPGAVCSALPGASTGFWKYTGSCDKVSCGPPSRPNTIFSPCDTHYGGTCTASCAAGYTGSVSAVCWVASGSMTGFWDYDGQCLPVSCGQPAVNGAHFEDCDTHYGSICSASCATGYTGSVSGVCSAATGASKGHWLYVGTCTSEKLANQKFHPLGVTSIALDTRIAPSSQARRAIASMMWGPLLTLCIVLFM